MRRLPHQQQLQPHQHGLRYLPPEGLSGNDKSQPRGRGFRADLPTVPQYDFVVECVIQPQRDGLPAYRHAYGSTAAVCRLPRQQ